MKKLAMLMMAICFLVGAYAQDLKSQEHIKLYNEENFPEGREYENWEGTVDYMNLVKKVNLKKYKTLYIKKITANDIKTQGCEYQNCEQVLKALRHFTVMLQEKFSSEYDDLDVQIVEDYDFVMSEKSVLFIFQFDELDYGKRKFSYKIPKIQMSAYVVENTGDFCFNFKHSYSSSNFRASLSIIYEELEDLVDDIEDVFDEME